MADDREKLIKAKEIILKMANGINPVNGQPIEKDSFLHDPRMIRCMFYISEVIEREIKGDRQIVIRPSNFIITPEEKLKVEFPEGSIGVNEFSRCINSVIDINKSKRLTGVELNKRLKKMGILSERVNDEGRINTITNEKSSEYGFEMVRASFNGREYDKVVINDKGKKFLLDNLEKIMDGKKE